MGSERTRQPVRAVDTNVVVRLIVGDHPGQTALARAELAQGIFLSHGILMETEWVLRSYYRLSREEVGAALSELVDHADVVTPGLDSVRWALDRFGNGADMADMADMLQIVAAVGQREFASFETGLAKQAEPDAPLPMIQLQ
jgi:predicted nucleic-acid-binding protein